MADIWRAARDGNLAEVERLVGEDPSRVNAKQECSMATPLSSAAEEGHIEVVRLLLDQGAAINEQEDYGSTAVLCASQQGHTPVVELLLERGADPTLPDGDGSTSLMTASDQGHLGVVRLLLDHPSAKTTIDNRDEFGETALLKACRSGRGGVARALLQSGADPTIADNDGLTPVAIAKRVPDTYDISADGRRTCVAALKVRCSHQRILSSTLLIR
jgi:ankyrin repeat protein